MYQGVLYNALRVSRLAGTRYCTITKPPLQGMVTFTGPPLWVRASRAPRKVAAVVWRGSSVRGAFLPWSLRAAFAVAGSTVSEYSV